MTDTKPTARILSFPGGEVIEPKPIEETWWKATTTTGLILTLPAPLRPTGLDVTKLEPMNAAQAMDLQVPVSSASLLTGKSYALHLRDVIHIEVFSLNPDRYRQALEKLVLRKSSTGYSDNSLDHASPSGGQTNRSGRSTGGTTKRNTH